MIAPAIALTAVALAAAPDAGVPQSTGTPVAPCPRGTDDRPARKAIAAIDEVVRRRGASLGELQAVAGRLEAEPCLAHAASRLPRGSLVAFRDWWRRGGRRWLERQIAPTRELLLPPDARPTLSAGFVSDSAAFARDRPVSPFPPLLLCPDAEVSCDPETGPWIAAAEAALEAKPGRPDEPMAGDSERCGDVASKFPPPQRYRAFVTCASLDRKDRVPRFPAGSFRAPRAGWLVVRSPGMAVAGEDQRGDGLAAYHLDSGAAYQVVSDVTAANQSVLRTGRVTPRLARQVAFLINFRDHLASSHARWRRYTVPQDIDLVWWTDPAFVVNLSGVLFKRYGGRVGWAWVADQAPIASGTIAFETKGGSVLDGYLEQMIDRLSKALVAGCAPQRPPADLMAQAPVPVDRFAPPPAPQRERELRARHEKAWQAALARPLCGQ